MPSLDQKQGLLGTPLHSHMLPYPYVDVFSLRSQNSTQDPGKSSETDFNLRLIPDRMPGLGGGVRFSADINYSGSSGLAKWGN
ncbi:hypothetical protein N7536_011107 [Penicillium majusculum]|nr:hypothetical protein N7536_011107 [Penicillium majusculum]